MRSFRLAILVLLLVGPATVSASQRAEHVVLVSIDGLRPEFYRDQTWPAPTLQQMARDGVWADGVRGVFPTVTYPSHTAIVTGALPARSGVYYNQPFEPGGQTGRWYWEEAAIQVPTLWDAVHAAGGTSAGVSWPVTVGAPIDWLLPEVWSLDPSVEPLQPTRETSRPPGLFEELEREATGRLTARTFSIDWISRDDKSGAAAAYLLETYRPTLLAVHLIEADHFQHEDGRDSDRARLAVGGADRALGAIREAAQRAGILERTAFVVVGDHGFVDLNIELAPNVWLAEAGLQEARRDRGKWRATFHAQGGSAFLHLRDPRDEEAVMQVRALLDALPYSYRKLFRVVEREELARVGADPGVPLALAAGRGVELTARADGPVVAAETGGQHGYFPTDFPEILTGFVGWGAGFRPGVHVHVMGLEDIAPLVAELLGLELDAPDGVAPLGVLVAPAAESAVDR